MIKSFLKQTFRITLVVVFLLGIFLFGLFTGKKTEDQISQSIISSNDNHEIYEALLSKQTQEIDLLRREIYRLETENTSVQKLLEEYGQMQCSPVQILMQAPEEIAQYGVSGLVVIGETELCGHNINVVLRAWGPSIAGYLDSLQKRYDDAIKEIEYYKTLAETAQGEKEQK